MAKELGMIGYMEASSLVGEGVKKAFDRLITQLYLRILNKGSTKAVLLTNPESLMKEDFFERAAPSNEDSPGDEVWNIADMYAKAFQEKSDEEEEEGDKKGKKKKKEKKKKEKKEKGEKGEKEKCIIF